MNTRRLRSSLRVRVLALISGFVVAAASACARPAPPAVPPLAWTVQPSGSDASLRGISAVDDRIAWASGSKGTVLRTVDGGSTWTAVPIAGEEASDFRDIEAFGPDDSVVMAIARRAKIFRTRDGGKTWRRTFFDDSPGIFLDSMAFFDDRNGLAVGDPMDARFLLIATADGGETWTPVPPTSRPAAAEGEAAFAGSGTSLAVHGNGRIWLTTGGSVSRVWRSADRGARWDAVPSRLLDGSASAGGFGVAFFDERRGITVGGDYRAEAASKGNAAVTHDGGRTWIAAGDQRPGWCFTINPR